ncbi:TolC family protein [Helicobacter cetorum]|uniref:Outer-membrane protein of the hefABC efflux system HefA n=1 Tax=Helicobacter cetorum (strain ATCC BAA-429 / MIT 00-7128) TaxID=182217 RepID=I0EN37_HELC0|nr:TolC family protein [Helicobacter cetorum]AFI04356.1 outer-membrane protein of the hefABC efflux system HefA [Helicobacter cetorum MIT 00-7128]
MKRIIKCASLWCLFGALLLAQEDSIEDEISVMSHSKSPQEIKQILKEYNHKNLSLINPKDSQISAPFNISNNPQGFLPLKQIDAPIASSITQEIAKYHEKSHKVALGLYELIKGADSNLSLQAQEMNVKQAMKNHTISKALFLPTLDVHYDFKNENRDTPEFKRFNTQQLQAKVKLNVFNGFSNVNNVREKSASYRSSVANLEYTRQSVYLQVVQQYYQYFNNLARLIALQKKLEQIKTDIKRVSKLYDQGLSTIDDLQSLKAQGSLSEYDILDVQFVIEQNRLTLEYLTNLNIENLKKTTIDVPNLQLRERQDLISLREQIVALKYQNKQLNYYPTVDIYDSWLYWIQKPAYALGRLGNFYPGQQNTAGVTVSLKVFDDIGLSLQKQSILLGQLASEKNLAYKKLEQEKDEQLYRKSLEIARAKIESSKASLKSASISFANIKRKYDANLVDFTTYLRGLSTRFDAEVAYNMALNNYEMQKANYIFYSGHKIQDYVH